jgi:hypothetical protein
MTAAQPKRTWPGGGFKHLSMISPDRCHAFKIDETKKHIREAIFMSIKLVKTSRADPPSPPRRLGRHGQALWTTIQNEYGITDGGGVELLAQACASLDRAESLSAQITRDGEVVRTKAGLRDHPALKHELANRSFVVRTLHRLGLDVEAVKPVGRPPGMFRREDN